LSAAREALPSAAANDSISACIDSGLIQTLCYQAGATRKSTVGAPLMVSREDVP
jgi:hypothetical protein